MLLIVALLIAAGLAQLPLLVEYFQQLWESPLLCFFPIAGLAVAALGWRERGRWFERIVDEKQEIETWARRRGNAGAFSAQLAVACVLLGVGHVFHVPSLGWLSLLLMGLAIAYWEYGVPGWKAALPLAVLLWFFKPIPDALEPWIQLWMQGLASRFAGVMLDFSRVFYYSHGVVLGLVSQEGLAVDVCNGVRSMGIAVFSAIAWGVFQRYHWFRTFLNVSQVLLWVILWNGVRIALLLGNQDAGGNWLNTPWLVGVIEYVCLAAILFFAWSGDQFLSSVVEPRKVDEPSNRVWEEESFLLRPAIDGMRWILPWSLVLLVLAWMGWRFSHLHSTEYEKVAQFASVNWPPEVQGWKVVASGTSEPVPFDPIFMRGYREHARVWTLEKDARKLQFEILGMSRLYPGPSWHWSWLGWSTGAKTRENTSLQENPQDGKLMDLARLPGEAGGAVAMGVDAAGGVVRVDQPNATVESMLGLMSSGLGYALGWKSKDEAREGWIGRPVLSVALYRKSARPLGVEDKKELLQLQRELMARWREIANGEGDPARSGLNP
ncbi:MAG: archaeosortase/exosortase family protein [Pirellula sp.]